MAHILANWVWQTSTSGGADTIELTGPPPSGYRAFSTVMANGDTTDAVVTDIETGLRQAARYSFADDVLTFVELIDSFTGSPVDFPPGPKNVEISPLASGSASGSGGGIPTPQIKALGSIKLSTMLGGNGNDPFMPKLKAFTDSAEFEGDKTYVFDRDWGWVDESRPTETGPNGEYITLPRFVSFEGAPGTVLDFSAYDHSGSGARVYMRAAGGLATPSYSVVGGVQKGADRIVLSSDDAIALANLIRATRPLPINESGSPIGIDQIYAARLLLSATARWLDDAGGFAQVDNPITVTGEIADNVLTVTVGAANVLAVGALVGGPGVADNTRVATAPPGGGVGVYTVTPGGQSVPSSTLKVSRGLNRRAESVLVEKIVGNTAYLLGAVQDDYDDTCMPAVQLYINEPEIKFTNPCAIGTGIDRFLQIYSGRNPQIVGGTIQNFSQSLLVLSCLGGRIRDLTMHGIQRGAPGGGLIYGNDTSALLIDTCTSYYGGQMFMQSGGGGLLGVTRNVTLRNLLAFFPFSAFTTHDTAELLSFERCKSYDSLFFAYDIRCRKVSVLDGEAYRSGRNAIITRGYPDGLLIDRFKAEDCLSGFLQQDDPYNATLGDITVRRSQFINTGGTGSYGGIAIMHGVGPTFPEMERVVVEDNIVSMKNNSPAYRILGKFKNLSVARNKALAADGYSPAGRSFIIDASPQNLVADGGPINLCFEGNRWDSSFADPYIVRTSGRTIFRDNGIIGETGTGANALTEDTILRMPADGDLFTNQGAIGEVDVDLPPVNSNIYAPRMTFALLEGQKFNLRASNLIAIQIGASPPSLNLWSDTDGADAKLRPYSGKLWKAEVDDDGNWHQDWSPFQLTDDGPWLGISSLYISRTIIDTGSDGGEVDPDTGDPVGGTLTEVATRWVDVLGSGLVLQTADASIAPLNNLNWLDFAGEKYLTDQTPEGIFLVGADPGCYWMIVKQVVPATDTTERVFFALGGSSVSGRRQISCAVFGGANRLSAMVGDGSTGIRANVAGVNFDGWCWVAMIYDGAEVTAVINGTESSPVAVVAATVEDRARVGASPSVTADLFCNGKINHFRQTPILDPCDRADYEAWLTAEVARLNELDP